MKPAIFHTLRRVGYASQFEIMAVTTARGRHYWGRDDHGGNTHAAERDCHGKFASEESARRVLADVNTAWRKHARPIAAAHAAERAAYAARDAEIRKIVAEGTDHDD